MTDLIDRRLVLKTLCERRCGDEPKGCPAGFCPESLVVDCLPSAQPEQPTQTNDSNTLNALDCISRQVAIAYAISGRVKTLPTSEDGENWIRTEEVRQSLLTMPSAQSETCEYWDDESNYCALYRPSTQPQPEPRWIPVTERLPEIGKIVLITIPLVNGYPWVRTARYGTLMFKNKVCFYESDSEWGDCEIGGVTAWMPLPQPYERSEDASNEG